MAGRGDEHPDEDRSRRFHWSEEDGPIRPVKVGDEPSDEALPIQKIEARPEQPREAFVLRLAPSGVDRVAQALNQDLVFIGWSRAKTLLDRKLDWEAFREILRREYHATDKNNVRAGQAAGHLWRFLREMRIGDMIVTPHGPGFYVARIESGAAHAPSGMKDDTAFRRIVTWLNEKRPIPRSIAKSALQSRMKSQGTCVSATDLLHEIDECLAIAANKGQPSFSGDLHTRLVRETLDEIRSGRLENFGFERLVQTVLMALGAREARIIPRALDKGADIVAIFNVAGAFQLRVAIQAKHFQAEPPVGVNVVQQLIQGIEAESANLGMVVTSGTISDEATAAAEMYFEQEGIRIELVDGPQLAALIVENGLPANQLDS